MKYFVIFLFLLIPLSVLLLFQNANGILVGDGREETDVILVGNVLSFVENKTSLETSYLVGVEKYLKIPKNYDTNTRTVNVISSGLRQYDDPQQARVYEKLFDINDRVLFLLYQKDGKLRESLYSQTTKSNCSPKQLLDEMYGENGLHFSQNNQTRHFYTNQPIDLTFYGYNIDLMAEKKDFEFKVNVPKTGQILSEKTQLDFQACKRTASASWSFTPTVTGKYGFHSIIGNNEGGSESFGGFLIEDYVEPPQKQYKSGITFDKIKCKESLILATKYAGSPACVKPETKIKLVERGWTQISESKQLSLYSNKFPNIEERNIQVNVGELRISQTGLSVTVLEKTSRTEPSGSIMFQQVTPAYSGSFNSDDILYEFFKVSSGEGEENITETYYDTPISNTLIAGNDKEYFSVYFPIEIPLKSSVQNSIIQFNYSLPYITPDFDQKYSFGLVSLSPLTINLPDDAKVIRNETSTYSSFWFFDKSGGELSHKTDEYMLYYGALNPPIKIQNLIVYNVEFELDAKK